MTIPLTRPRPAYRGAASPTLSPGTTTRDTVTILTFYIALRIILPSQYVIGTLGGAGQPAQLLGLGIALLWVTAWLGRPWGGTHLAQPLKRYAAVFFVAVLASYLMAALRPLSPTEQLAADRGLLDFIAWFGVLLAAMDGISTRSRLDILLRRVVLIGGLEGALGAVQLLAKQSFLQYFQLPGLADTGVDPLLLTRGSFLRPVGTAISPIEYGVFLAMILPIALHYAVADAGRRSFAARWVPVAAISAALSVSLTRSAIIATVVGLTLLVVAWPPHLRRRIYIAAVAFIAVASISLKGFLGTVLSLFGGIGTDSSTTSRVDSYAVAWSFITRSPIFGRGPGTFLPEYWILDNQLLGSLIELGVIGLACMILLFVNGTVTAWRVPRPVSGPDSRSALGPALAAAAAAGVVGFAFFDAYGFPMVPSTLFLVIGCAGALRRLTLADADPEQVPPGTAGVTGSLTVWSLAARVRKRWPVAVAGALLTLVGSYAAATASGVYYEQANVVLIAPDGSGLQAGGGGLVATAGVIESQLKEQGALALSSTATIVGAGIRNGTWVRLPNNGDQWATNFDEQALDVEVVESSASQVQAQMTATISRIKTLLRQDQNSDGVRSRQLVKAGLSPASPPVYYMTGSSSRAGITAFGLGMILTLTITVMADRWAVKTRRALDGAPESQALTAGNADLARKARSVK